MPDRVSLARSLRRRATWTEIILWKHLRNAQINGRKWRRQQVIDRYVVDFFCPELRLVLEIDGEAHRFHHERDAERQEYLEAQGLRVVRVKSDDVLQSLERVLDWIRELTE